MIPTAEAPEQRRKGAAALNLLWIAVALATFSALGAVVNRTITCHVLRRLGEELPSCAGL